KGTQLSGGEWQKVALARSFMRAAPILVLDEPTSALDAQAEYELFARLRSLAEGGTAVFIPPRFSTVRKADRIFLFHEGRLAEQGTHSELMRLAGRYAELSPLQPSAYLDCPPPRRPKLLGVGCFCRDLVLAIVGWWRASYLPGWFTGRLWLRWDRALPPRALRAARDRPVLSGSGRPAGSSSSPGFSRRAVPMRPAGTAPGSSSSSGAAPSQARVCSGRVSGSASSWTTRGESGYESSRTGSSGGCRPCPRGCSAGSTI